MQKTASELAVIVGGKLEGDPALVISGVAGLREAGPGQAGFLEHPRYAALLGTTQASVVLVEPGVKVPEGRTVIRVAHPSVAFGKIVALISPKPPSFKPGIHSSAQVSSSASVHPTASIQPFAVIEEGARVGARTVVGVGCYIGHETDVGDDCMFYANVVIRECCCIGDRVILHPGVVIGSDGFGYDWVKDHYEKIPQVGIVRIEDDVEIGANTTVDRGRFGSTWIKRGVKIDNLVQIAHNVVIDENTVIAAQTGISGSTIIGKRVRIAGQVGTVGHITIGDDAILYAQSGVHHDVAKGQSVFGYPAQDHKEALKTHAAIRRLPHIVERLRELEKKIGELEATREKPPK